MGFDEHALVYDQQLRNGLQLAGDGPEWFAEQRVRAVRGHIDRLGWTVRCVLEFGCGVGNHVPYLRNAFPGSRIVGVDISQQSLDIARARYQGSDVQFHTPDSFTATGEIDLIYINGVFHHIPPQEHADCIRSFRRLLRPGGVVAVFDNNPLSLPARWVMSRIEFDRDAIMVSPRRLARLLSNEGFGVAGVEYHFIFPRMLSFLRPVETSLASLPFGAQYCVLARLPG
jgi:SAM-dependent methyltransferase